MGGTAISKTAAERIDDLEKKLLSTRKELKALKESEKQYRLLIENANDAIFIIQDGRVRFSNPRTQHIGQPLSLDLSTTPFTDFIHEEDRLALKDLLSGRTEAEASTGTFMFRLVNPDGDELWLEMYHAPTQWKGKPAAIFFLRDISASRKLEEQFQLSQRMEAIGTLAGGVAHNFNNLLQVIQGNISYLMLDKKFCEPYTDEITHIEKSIESGAKLTRQLLSFARSGDFSYKPININDVIKTTSQMFARTFKEIKIHQYLQKQIWTVEADAAQIELVLINMYINAKHALAEGGDLYLHTENAVLDEADVLPYEKEAGKYVKVSITDTGIGMTQKVSQKIFEPFFTTKKEGMGTGLGLSTAYGIIKQHGGFIGFETEPGKGTTFNIHLPATDKIRMPAGTAPDSLEVGNGTILLVDDESNIITIGKLLIEEIGYRVITAHGGRQAIDKFKDHLHEIDMVILDIIMPDMDGGKVFDELKKLKPEVKVLLSSGYSQDGYVKSILDRGCDGFIQKPFTIAHLSSEIKKIIGRP